MKAVLRYLNSLLAYFGFVTPRVKRYDIALNLLDQTRRNAAVISDRSARDDDAPHPGSSRPGPDTILLYRQLETLREYVATYDLLLHGPSDEEQLGSLATDLLTNKNHDQIVPRLDNVATLLEIHRALLTGTVRSTPSKSYSPAPVGQPAGIVAAATPIQPRGEAPDEALSPQDKKPEDYAFLWNTTEKLYDSWPIKLLGAFLISAVLLAGGGTLLIGGKALELRKTLEDAGNKETASFETFAKTTRETVAAQSQTLLSNLNRQQTEITQKMDRTDQQIRDLESRTTQIRDAAVERVSKDIRDNFSAVERRLKEDIEALLLRMKDGDVRDLQNKVTQLSAQVQTFAKDVSDKQTAITIAEPKIKALTEATANVGNLKTQADLIPGIKSSAEEALKTITEARQAALNADSGVQRLAKEVESRLTPQMNKILEYEGKLGGNERGLYALTAAIDKIRLDTASTQRILNGAERANNSLNLISDRLVELNKAVDELEKRVKRSPPAVDPVSSPKPLPLTDKDLSRDQWLTIQKSLNTRKFYSGKLDGQVGAATRSAIGKYQQAKNMTANEILTLDQISDLLGPPAN
jgi:hypothetical protein